MNFWQESLEFLRGVLCGWNLADKILQVGLIYIRKVLCAIFKGLDIIFKVFKYF